MKYILIAILIFNFYAGCGQTFRIDSIGARKGHTLPLFEKTGDSTKVYYSRIYGAGRSRLRVGMIGTILKTKNRTILSFIKK